jgi:hypothetical protein
MDEEDENGNKIENIVKYDENINVHKRKISEVNENKEFEKNIKRKKILIIQSGTF